MAAKKHTVEEFENKDLISLDECAKRLQELLKMDKPYSTRTLQNKISRNEFKRYGARFQTRVDWNEVRDKALKTQG